MDKNNDIKVNKVDKWDKGIADESLWQAKTSVDAFLCGYSSMLSIEALDAVRTIYVFLDEALDHFNELEARHQKDTGMISEYEEENKSLKSELDIKNDECDALISRVFKQDDEYTKLEAEAKKLRENNELCMKAHLRLLDESTKLATENEKLRSKCESKEADIRDLEVQARVNASMASAYKSELKQVIELAKSYGVIIYDERKNVKPDNAINIGMCGYYYVLDGDYKNEVNRLKKENNNLITDNKRLSNAVEAWFDMFIDMRHKRDFLEKENKKLKETNTSLRLTVRILDGEGYF